MMKLRFAMAFTSILVASSAFAVSPELCAVAAKRLGEATAVLEKTTGELAVALTDSRPRLENLMRTQARSALAAGERMREDCDAGPTSAAPVKIVLDLMRSRLNERFGDAPDFELRLRNAEPSLVAIAQAHTRSRPSDFRMTMAVAELVFLGSSRK